MRHKQDKVGENECSLGLVDREELLRINFQLSIQIIRRQVRHERARQPHFTGNDRVLEESERVLKYEEHKLLAEDYPSLSPSAI